MTSFAFSSVYLEICIIYMNIYSKNVLGIINVYSKNYHYEKLYMYCRKNSVWCWLCHQLRSRIAHSDSVNIFNLVINNWWIIFQASFYIGIAFKSLYSFYSVLCLFHWYAFRHLTDWHSYTYICTHVYDSITRENMNQIVKFSVKECILYLRSTWAYMDNIDVIAIILVDIRTSTFQKFFQINPLYTCQIINWITYFIGLVRAM
jgi:hypothetical protein